MTFNTYKKTHNSFIHFKSHKTKLAGNFISLLIMTLTDGKTNTDAKCNARTNDGHTNSLS